MDAHTDAEVNAHKGDEDIGGQRKGQHRRGVEEGTGEDSEEGAESTEITESINDETGVQEGTNDNKEDDVQLNEKNRKVTRIWPLPPPSPPTSLCATANRGHREEGYAGGFRT